MTAIRPRGHTWDDLQNPDPVDDDERTVDATFAAVFGTIAGQKALEFMHLLTTFKRNKPNDSDGALRWMEAQRTFVATIEARIQRHAKQVAAQSGGRGTPESRSGTGRRNTVSRRRGTPAPAI